MDIERKAGQQSTCKLVSTIFEVEEGNRIHQKAIACWNYIELWDLERPEEGAGRWIHVKFYNSEGYAYVVV